MPRLFLFGATIMVLLTAACGANQNGSATPAGTILPSVIDTSTASGVDTTLTAVASTPFETPTSEALLQTPLATATLSVPAQGTVVSSPTAGTAQNPPIPVTGLDVMLVECQFCVDNLAHALLVLPDTATFEVVNPASSNTNVVNTNCSTIEVNNGKQVVLCSGPEKTALTLNICTNVNTCMNFPVQLLACPLAQPAPIQPNTTKPAPGAGAATDTAVPAASPTPGALSTATATSTP